MTQATKDSTAAAKKTPNNPSTPNNAGVAKKKKP